MDKSNIPVFIISLNGTSKYNFYKLFNNVNYYKPIDTRQVNIENLLNDNIISQRVYYDIIFGRKDHFAIPGMGAIGLYLTYVKLLNELYNKNFNKNVLIFEEDCNITKEEDFLKKIKLLQNFKNFDCVVFGSNKYNIYFNDDANKQFIKSNNILSSHDLNPDISKHFKKLNYIFYRTQSCLWSFNGIKKMCEYFNKHNIVDVQIDWLLGVLSLQNKLNVLHEKSNTTNQYKHLSSLGNDQVCKLCDSDPKSKKNTKHFTTIIKNYIFLLLLIIFIIIFIILLFKK